MGFADSKDGDEKAIPNQHRYAVPGNRGGARWFKRSASAKRV
jgi:hypothetical protein